MTWRPRLRSSVICVAQYPFSALCDGSPRVLAELNVDSAVLRGLVPTLNHRHVHSHCCLGDANAALTIWFDYDRIRLLLLATGSSPKAYHEVVGHLIAAIRPLVLGTPGWRP